MVTCANGVNVPDVGLNSCWANLDYLDDDRIYSENDIVCKQDGLRWIGTRANPNSGFCGSENERILADNQEMCQAERLDWISTPENPSEGFCGIREPVPMTMPAQTSEMFPDDLSAVSEEELVQQPVEDNACEGVRCIRLYKPCEEGYIDADPCCPNTGNCIPDPDYVAVDAPALPVGQTPSTEFDEGFEEVTPIAYAGLVQMQPIRSTPSPVERTSTSPEPEPEPEPEAETSTPEAPKTNGLAAVAIGLIALELLAT